MPLNSEPVSPVPVKKITISSLVELQDVNILAQNSTLNFSFISSKEAYPMCPRRWEMDELPLCSPRGLPRDRRPCQTPALQADGQGTSGDFRSSVCCHNLPQTHLQTHPQAHPLPGSLVPRPCHPRAGDTGQGSAVGMGTAAPELGIAAGAKHARRFYLTFTNRS